MRDDARILAYAGIYAALIFVAALTIALAAGLGVRLFLWAAFG